MFTEKAEIILHHNFQNIYFNKVLALKYTRVLINIGNIRFKNKYLNIENRIILKTVHCLISSFTWVQYDIFYK